MRLALFDALASAVTIRPSLARRLLPTVRQVYDVLPSIADGSVPRPLSGADVNSNGEVVLRFADGLIVNIGRVCVAEGGRKWVHRVQG